MSTTSVLVYVPWLSINIWCVHYISARIRTVVVHQYMVCPLHQCSYTYRGCPSIYGVSTTSVLVYVSWLSINIWCVHYISAHIRIVVIHQYMVCPLHQCSYTYRGCPSIYGVSTTSVLVYVSWLSISIWCASQCVLEKSTTPHWSPSQICVHLQSTIKMHSSICNFYNFCISYVKAEVGIWLELLA